MGPVQRVFAAALVFAAMAAAHPMSSHAAQEVDLELALGIDVSGSIDEEEAMLQREGYIAAFRHPSVVKAIRSGILGRIAVAYYEWAGFGHMKVIADWTVISDKASADAFADTLLREPPETARRTAIGDAINFAVPFFERNDYKGLRRVVDISGDGPVNWGAAVTEARDAAVRAGVTINGLPIVNNRPTFSGRLPMPNLDLYYKKCVIGGPGAFIVVARDFRDFARAVRRKLILEIAGPSPGDGAAPASRHAGLFRPKHPLLHRIADTERTIPPCESGRWWSPRWFYSDPDDTPAIIRP